MPLLTIIVPTSDRPHTAEPCVRELSVIPGDIEILVVDCSQTDGLRSGMAAIGDPRIRYFHGPPCSMTENWNRAIGLVRGEYVAIIGDDDVFLPSGVRAVESLAAQGAEAIAYPYDSTYFWDDFPDETRAGQLQLCARAGPPAAQEIDARAWTIGMLKGRADIPPPVIYHGVVARHVLDEIKQRRGQVFRTVAPDTYLTGLLCRTLRSYMYVPRPLSVFGKSGASNSGRLFKKDPQQHFEQYAPNEFFWSPLLPPVETVEAQLAHSYLEAFTGFEDPELLDAFKHYFLAETYVLAAARNRRKIGRIAAHFFRTARPQADIDALRFAFSAAGVLAARLKQRLAPARPGGDPDQRVWTPCANLAEAVARTEAACAWTGADGAAAE